MFTTNLFSFLISLILLSNGKVENQTTKDYQVFVGNSVFNQWQAKHENGFTLSDTTLNFVTIYHDKKPLCMFDLNEYKMEDNFVYRFNYNGDFLSKILQFDSALF